MPSHALLSWETVEGGPRGEECFTLSEAASLLVPEIETWQLELLVQALKIKPHGTRYLPRGGRPPRTFSITEIMRLHTAVAPWLAASSSG